MAKNNAVANNETVNNDIQKEEKAMDVKQENAPVQEQQATTPVAAPVATDQQVPAEVPAATPQTFAEKHPKLAAAGAKAKQIGKWVGLGAAVVGGLFVAHKLGEASGFDKATDAYNSRHDDDESSSSDESSDNDLGEADFNEVSDDE